MRRGVSSRHTAPECKLACTRWANFSRNTIDRATVENPACLLLCLRRLPPVCGHPQRVSTRHIAPISRIRVPRFSDFLYAEHRQQPVGRAPSASYSRRHILRLSTGVVVVCRVDTRALNGVVQAFPMFPLDSSTLARRTPPRRVSTRHTTRSVAFHRPASSCPARILDAPSAAAGAGCVDLTHNPSHKKKKPAEAGFPPHQQSQDSISLALR